MERQNNAQDFAQASIASAQQRNKENGNLSTRQPVRFGVGVGVWLGLKHIKLQKSQKFILAARQISSNCSA